MSRLAHRFARIRTNTAKLEAALDAYDTAILQATTDVETATIETHEVSSFSNGDAQEISQFVTGASETPAPVALPVALSARQLYDML